LDQPSILHRHRCQRPAEVTQTLNFSRKHPLSMRMAALRLGMNRVREAKQARRLFP